MFFGDLEDPASEVRKILSTRYSIRRKQELGTQPSVFYIIGGGKMLEKALVGSRRYWTWVFFLSAIVGIGFINYLFQFKNGLGITGMSRDVSWGLYIGQFTFLVGVAASAVMLVIPTISMISKNLERLLSSGVSRGRLGDDVHFVYLCGSRPADEGIKCDTAPDPNSILFWDMIVLNGYLFLT